MNGEVTTEIATPAASIGALGLTKTSKKRKPKRPSLLDKAVERGSMGYSPVPTSGAEADATNYIEE